MSQKMVSQHHRHRLLQMGVARKVGVGIGIGLDNKRALKPEDEPGNVDDLAFGP